MTSKQQFFQFMSRSLWLSLLLLMGLGGGIQGFVTVGFSLEPDSDRIQRILITENTTEDDRTNSEVCKPGCDPNPRYVM